MRRLCRGDKTLRYPAFRAFIDVMHKTRLFLLDARKPHPPAAFEANGLLAEKLRSGLRFHEPLSTKALSRFNDRVACSLCPGDPGCLPRKPRGPFRRSRARSEKMTAAAERCDGQGLGRKCLDKNRGYRHPPRLRATGRPSGLVFHRWLMDRAYPVSEPSMVLATNHACFLKRLRNEAAIWRRPFRSGPGGYDLANRSIWRRRLMRCGMV